MCTRVFTLILNVRFINTNSSDIYLESVTENNHISNVIKLEDFSNRDCYSIVRQLREREIRNYCSYESRINYIFRNLSYNP